MNDSRDIGIGSGGAQVEGQAQRAGTGIAGTCVQ